MILAPEHLLVKLNMDLSKKANETGRRAFAKAINDWK